MAKQKGSRDPITNLSPSRTADTPVVRTAKCRFVVVRGSSTELIDTREMCTATFGVYHSTEIWLTVKQCRLLVKINTINGCTEFWG